ncbi:MAG: sigma-70 family RNA polymerase sigma factor [Flammeovirgaceae bacterium]|nr:sigma-70 family RNA polymerase sigma factor [Flammeovirgaceae bacterium]
MQEEFDVIDQVIKGDHDLYRVLVDRYKSYAFTIALKILKDKEEAEEAAQDAFIKAYKYLGKFDKRSKFSTWLYRIVFNTAVSYKRKMKVQHSSVENISIEDSLNHSSAIELKDKRKFINQALNRLSDQDQVAVQMFYLKELSLEEVSILLNVNLNTIKVRIHRARQRLADELKTILKDEALTL